MRLQQLFTDDEAVSPVIGVILMVAITVILAAVIGAFVLGFGDSTSSAPTISADATQNDTGAVTFTINSAGEELENGTLHLRGSGLDSERTFEEGPYGAGDSFTNDSSVSSGTVSLVWDDGSTSNVVEEIEIE